MNIWTGLLFLDGAIADAQLARELAGAETADAATRSESSTARETPAAAAGAHPAGTFRGAVPH